MQGKILEYGEELKSGLIRGEDGNRYHFEAEESGNRHSMQIAMLFSQL